VRPQAEQPDGAQSTLYKTNQKIIMLNFPLSHIPDRTEKPRSRGLTMVMDKGLSLQEAAGLIETAAHLADFVKIGFGTSAVTANIEKKISLYMEAGISVYLGGTLFEAFYIRGQEDEYIRTVKKFGLDTVEISDGCIRMDHKEKCALISKYAKEYTVISEVGAKDASVTLDNALWIQEMQNELSAGAFKVIAEARESGTVGIFSREGTAETGLIDEIAREVDVTNVIWETPLKTQQVWFIKKFGTNVNLGNIAPAEVIALETLRLGLRGDTFFDFLPSELRSFQIQ
jgi:phosphosulfolactate synthase